MNEQIDKIAYNTGMYCDGTPDSWDSAAIEKFAQQIVNTSKKSRQLLIQSTNMDSGMPHIFNFIDAAKDAVSIGNPNTLTDILLSTSAIPVAFEPREINGSLFADGTLSSNIF